MRDWSKLSFYKKMRLLELLYDRYPNIGQDLREWFPEYEGEVPFEAFLSDEQIEELIKEISKGE